MALVVIYLVLTVLTLGYAYLVYLGIGLFNGLYSPDNLGPLQLVSRLTVSDSLVIVWQIVAGVSLIASMLWSYAIKRSTRSTVRASGGINRPIILHLAWLAASLVWIAVGALRPFLSTAYILVQ